MSEINATDAPTTEVPGVQPAQHIALHRLTPLIGTWDMHVVLDGQQVLGGRTEFSWSENGAFLLGHADATVNDSVPVEWAENMPFPTTTITGLDDTTDDFTVLYADSRDVSRVYRMNVRDGLWTMWRDAPEFYQRFTATFSTDGRTITSRWKDSSDGETWTLDFDLIYTKVG